MLLEQLPDAVTACVALPTGLFVLVAGLLFSEARRLRRARRRLEVEREIAVRARGGNYEPL